MIKDGVDEPSVEGPLHAEGWKPIVTAPPTKVLRVLGYDIAMLFPNVIEGLTAAGKTVVARYMASGDYEDRWVDAQTGNIEYKLTHWREL